LAVAFLIVALLPAVPLSLVVSNLLERRFGPAIADPLETALDAGLFESRERLRELKAALGRAATDLKTQGAISGKWPEEAVTITTATPGTGGGRIELVVLGADNIPVAVDEAAEMLVNEPDLLARSPQPSQTVAGGPLPEPVRVGGVLVTTIVIDSPDDEADAGLLLVARSLPAGMVERAGELTGGLRLLRIVRSESGRVLLSFLAPFLVIYGLLILVALATGTLWARRMVRPLEALVEGTRRVGAGDLDTRVAVPAPGEVGDLVQAFDTMVGRLGDQRRDLARLERAAAWRGMARTLAHEVKNPLTPILMAVQEARDAYRGDDTAYAELLTECTDIVREEVDSLRRLVREFGDFARLPKPEPTQGDLILLGRDLEQLYGEQHLSLVATVDQLEGWFDYQALRRALINLIDNGLAACREQGAEPRVTLTIEAAAPGGRILVADRGAGIPQENLVRIFTPDFTTKGDGMGLGLAIVDSVVAGHGGTISVESELGRGSVFSMSLPLTTTEGKAAAGEDPDGTDAGGVA